MLGQEDPLEKGMATYSSILAWRIPRTDHGGCKETPLSGSQKPSRGSVHSGQEALGLQPAFTAGAAPGVGGACTHHPRPSPGWGRSLWRRTDSGPLCTGNHTPAGANAPVRKTDTIRQIPTERAHLCYKLAAGRRAPPRGPQPGCPTGHSVLPGKEGKGTPSRHSPLLGGVSPGRGAGLTGSQGSTARGSFCTRTQRRVREPCGDTPPHLTPCFERTQLKLCEAEVSVSLSFSCYYCF